MNHKLANGMKTSKENGNTNKLSFSLKGLKILHKKRKEQVKAIVMEHFNGILFHKCGPGNKQHTNHHHHQVLGIRVPRVGSIISKYSSFGNRRSDLSTLAEG